MREMGMSRMLQMGLATRTAWHHPPAKGVSSPPALPFCGMEKRSGRLQSRPSAVAGRNLARHPARRAFPPPLAGVWMQACRAPAAEAICTLLLSLAGIGSLLLAFATVWLRLQNWPAFEAWVQRLGGG